MQQSAANRLEPRTFIGRFVTRLSRVWLLSLLACQIAIWAEPEMPQLALLEHLAMPFASLALILSAVAAIRRLWPTVLLSGILFFSLSWPIDNTSEGAIADGERIRVVSLNLWRYARDGADTLALLQQSNADVIGLVEVTPQWLEWLAPLMERYPYRAHCFETAMNCKIMLLSRLPLRQPLAAPTNGGMPFVAGAELEWGERRFDLFVTHVVWPFNHAGPNADFSPLEGDLPLTLQAQQMANLARFANARSNDLVLMGDFNSVPWSRVGRAFRAATGLENHYANLPTWPSWLVWPFMLSIDHILARGRPVLVEYRTLDRANPDHLAVEAQIAWRP